MKPVVIAFIDRSFRDVADHDYLLARMAYRFELHLQFIWLAQQAIEKYLKALLLYNNRSALKLKHNVLPAFRRVMKIRDIPFDFPHETADFMNYLDLRASRYFEYPYAVSPYRLFDLDRTVWFLRRYCDYIRGAVQTSGGVRGRLEHEISRRGRCPVSQTSAHVSLLRRRPSGSTRNENFETAPIPNLE
jgi:HEPN domain-containing protein